MSIDINDLNLLHLLSLLSLFKFNGLFDFEVSESPVIYK